MLNNFEGVFHDNNYRIRGFGMRMHPIYKILKMHKGMDLACMEI